MTININGSTPVFTSDQTCVVVRGPNVPQIPQVDGALAPSTDGSLYYSGRLLSKYGADAPAGLSGTYVNYDPASLNDDQKVPTHVISGEFVSGVSGVDITSGATAAATLNIVPITPLLNGLTLYENSLTENNPSAVMTGFEAYFNISTVTTTKLQGADCDVISIQGVA
jgi:hypothetical protein